MAKPPGQGAGASPPTSSGASNPATACVSLSFEALIGQIRAGVTSADALSQIDALVADFASKLVEPQSVQQRLCQIVGKASVRLAIAALTGKGRSDAPGACAACVVPITDLQSAPRRAIPRSPSLRALTAPAPGRRPLVCHTRTPAPCCAHARPLPSATHRPCTTCPPLAALSRPRRPWDRGRRSCQGWPRRWKPGCRPGGCRFGGSGRAAGRCCGRGHGRRKQRIARGHQFCSRRASRGLRASSCRGRRRGSHSRGSGYSHHRGRARRRGLHALRRRGRRRARCADPFLFCAGPGHFPLDARPRGQVHGARRVRAAVVRGDAGASPAREAGRCPSLAGGCRPFRRAPRAVTDFLGPAC